MGTEVEKTHNVPDQREPWVERTVKIRNRQGLHGRPTTLFVTTAQRFESEILVSWDGSDEEVDGKSAISLLSLGAACGGALRIRARGKDAQEAVDTLVRLVENGFQDEEEE